MIFFEDPLIEVHRKTLKELEEELARRKAKNAKALNYRHLGIGTLESTIAAVQLEISKCEEKTCQTK